MRRRRNLWLGLGAAAVVLGACGEDSVTPPGSEPEDVSAFVGTWDAEVFTVTSQADTSIVADLMENGSFVITVQPSASYTATLTFGGMPLVEIGTLSVEGDHIILRPDGGSSATSSYDFVREDYLVLDGSTEFDFNLDDELDPARAHIELLRR
jgi:hypothetical protein